MRALGQPIGAKVGFERTGGVAGTTLRAMIDTTDAPADEAQPLAALLDAADFFELPARIMPEHLGADRFEYRISVEFAGRRHTVVTTDGAAPASLEPLLDYLAGLAKVSRTSREAD
jgi:Emfourin